MKNSQNNEFEQTALEIYMLFRNLNGSLSGVAGHIGDNDSSRISRQLNPTDDRRDHPIIETLKILKGARAFSPELEEQIWLIIERERSRHCVGTTTFREQLAELLYKIHSELGDLVYKNGIGAPQSELENEGFELLKAVETYYEKLKQARTDR